VLHDYALYKSTFTLLYFTLSAESTVQFVVPVKECHLFCVNTETAIKNVLKRRKFQKDSSNKKF